MPPAAPTYLYSWTHSGPQRKRIVAVELIADPERLGRLELVLLDA